MRYYFQIKKKNGTLYFNDKIFQTKIFSGHQPESRYFPAAARPKKTYFLATNAEKFYTALVQNKEYPKPQ